MKFLRYLTEGIEDKGIFKAVFLAGHPGSGKSYTLDRIKSGQIEPRIVNTDKFVEHYKNADWMALSALLSCWSILTSKPNAASSFCKAVV